MQVAQVLAPTTLVTGLMIYYGYVATYAKFRYFGIALEAMDLTVQELILYGTETMWVPLATLLLLVLAFVGIHAVHLRLIATGKWPRRVRGAGIVMMVVGLGLVIRSVVGVVVPQVARDETAGVTPLSLSVGALLIAYGGYVVMRTWSRPRWVTVLAVLTTVGLVMSGAVWATNSFASAFGRGVGITISRHLHEYPEAVIDTTERLKTLAAPDRMQLLPTAKGEKFKYRYRGMRLLTEAGGRLFLVPEKWTASSGTLVLPYNADIRVHFLPEE
ncbi:hypothetical protein Misp01_11170 [Microtetraspora sp. NBRC 13810]|uniref:hypothetical protein n=1 Tax=Microtetraspora sp. NBRC 13810 TaxID=3030990 RepID=UPI0024A2B0E4|nr:hypothetical protein [Microtetraspora sp. NBRC 13810]GLW05987.1 hypothetical protein Misp01_11170 [Microtetraspora sp. NBRC 13810]